MKLTLGFSPCPNDTFIFDALVNKRIDTKGLSFEVILEDVETLNRLAIKNSLHITKISYGVLPLLLQNYIVLNSGSALGRCVGPLLIAGPLHSSPVRGGLEHFSKDEEWINNSLIALPGEHTTAHMLFKLAFPEATKKLFLRYNEIEDFVLAGSGLGVIIHENRFTYENKGLKKIIDLGEYWEKKTGSSIPLGGIIAKRSIEPELLKQVEDLIRQSIRYSFENYPAISDYVRTHSRETDEIVMRKHIDLYVNDFSIDLGEEGKKAIMKLLEISAGSDPAKNFVFL